MPELSVIVPVYRAERFLERCIDSILAQTFTDFELFLIDDGSPDRSGEICDGYAERDKRITVIHQENKGVSAARNAALELASGKYITFVDADDAIDTTAYAVMLKKAEETQAEIVCCGVQYYSETGEYKRSDLTAEFSCNRDEMLLALYALPDPLGGSCCNKIFLHKTVADVRYREGVAMGEDWLYLFEAFTKATLQYKMPDAFYWVTEHENSSARKKDTAIPVKILKSSREMMRLGKKYSPKIGKAAVNKYLDDCLRYTKQIEQIGTQCGQPYRLKIFVRKLDMAAVLLDAAIRKQLPKEKVHGYLFGLIKE